jgi:hypothetical protein
VAAAWHGLGGGFIPLQDLTIAPENGFPTSEAKEAFGAGRFTLKMQLPQQAGTGTVVYPDGSRLDVPVVGAASAYQMIARNNADCPGCTPLTVTAARLGTAALRTNRGVATVPAWLFTLEGIGAPMARVAVAPEAITPVPTPSLPADPDLPLVSAQDLLSVNGSVIEYRLGVGACDKEITGLVWEDAEVVVVGGSVASPPPDQACTAQLVLHPVKVTTREPVGNRLIVDALTGVPVRLR